MPEATHHVIMVGNWEANMYIKPTTLLRAYSGNTTDRGQICLMFRIICEAKDGDKFKRACKFVEWNMLKITVLKAESNGRHVSDNIPGWIGTCCGQDDCNPCNGNPELRHDHCKYQTCKLRPVRA